MEIAKKPLQEKIIFQSICYFTIATEIRFIEMEINKLQQKAQAKLSTLKQDSKIRIQRVFPQDEQT